MFPFILSLLICHKLLFIDLVVICMLLKMDYFSITLRIPHKICEINKLIKYKSAVIFNLGEFNIIIEIKPKMSKLVKIYGV